MILVCFLELKNYELAQNYPNPFNPSTKISFSLTNGGFVKLDVYVLNGALIRELLSVTYSAGNHSVSFDASEFPSGIYLYKISAAEFSDSKKMVLIK